MQARPGAISSREKRCVAGPPGTPLIPVVGNRLRHGPPHPVVRVADETDAALRIEAVRGAHEPQIPLVHEVGQRDAAAAVPARDGYDEAEIRADEPHARRLVAGPAPPRQFRFGFRVEQALATDVRQVAFENADHSGGALSRRRAESGPSGSR